MNFSSITIERSHEFFDPTGMDIVRADLVEVAPPYDSADITSHLAANLVFELLCVLAPVVARLKVSLKG